MLVDFSVREEHEVLRWVLYWICFLQTHNVSLHKLLIDGLELCGLLVDHWDSFISCLDSFWRHPFIAEDPLANKWFNAKCIHLFWWRNKLLYILDDPRVSTTDVLLLQHFYITHLYSSKSSSVKTSLISFLKYLEIKKTDDKVNR